MGGGGASVGMGPREGREMACDQLKRSDLKFEVANLRHGKELPFLGATEECITFVALWELVHPLIIQTPPWHWIWDTSSRAKPFDV